jgi:hypothetical protein
MNKLWLVLALGGLAYGGLWWFESPRVSMAALVDGAQRKDMAKVDAHLDASRLAASMGKAGVAMTQAALVGGNGGALSGLINLIGAGAAQMASVEAGGALRRSIEQDGLPQKIGPFSLLPGTDALGDVQDHGKAGLVEIKGTCNGAPAAVQLVLERQERGPVMGRPRSWMVVGVDETSATGLLKTCLTR